MVTSINFTHSSRLAWKTIIKLYGKAPGNHKRPIMPDFIAQQVVSNGKFPKTDKCKTREVHKELKIVRNSTGSASRALQLKLITQKRPSRKMKTGKATGPDGIYPEFLVNCGNRATQSLSLLLTMCLATQ